VTRGGDQTGRRYGMGCHIGRGAVHTCEEMRKQPSQVLALCGGALLFWEIRVSKAVRESWLPQKNTHEIVRGEGK